MKKSNRALHFRASALSLFLVVALALMSFAAQISVPQQTEAFYVLDDANILSASTEQHILDTSAALCQETGAEFVVVTEQFIGDADIGDYATKLFNDWQIGDPNKNNGLLLLLVTGEENYWCLQGKGLEDSLSSGTISDILYEYLEPYFAEGDYDAGTLAVYDAFVDKLEGIYGVDVSGTVSSGQTGSTSAVQPTPSQPAQTHTGGSGIFVTLFFVILFLAVLCMLGGFLMRMRAPRRPRHFGGFYGMGRGPQMYRRRTPPPPPMGGGMGAPRPPMGGMGGARPTVRTSRPSRPSSGGFGRTGGGGISRGGGAGRSSGGFSSSRSSFGGGMGGGRTGGGGMSRGGGAGRR